MLLYCCSREFDLFLSCAHQDLDRLKMLVTSGKVNVDSKNENNETVLMHACALGDVLMVQTLIEFGANIHKEDINGWSPLMFACSHGHAPVADILIQVRMKIISFPIKYMYYDKLHGPLELGYNNLSTYLVRFAFS